MDDVPQSDWKKVNLGSVCEVIGGGTPSSSVSDYWDGDIPWASPSEITRLSTRYISETARSITKKGLEESSAKLHPIGTVLMTSRASIGFAAINIVPMSTNQGFQSLRCKKDTHNEFIFQLVNFIRPKLLILSAGSTFPEISSKNVKKIELALPPLPEQKKIATILTSVDTVIEKTQAQIDKLNDLKTGMMQELLTKGIGPDGKPHTEFKDSAVGRIPVGWNVTELGNLVNEKSPICYGILMPGKHVEGGIPVIKVKNIQNNRIDESGLLQTSKEIDQNYSRSKVQSGDILVTIRGTTGRVAFVPSSLNDANITQDSARVRIEPPKLANYVFNCLQGPAAQSYIEDNTIGQAVKGINLKELRKLLIKIPPTEELEKITSALENTNTFLKAKRASLISLRNLKTALMQDLLTGKVRTTPDPEPTPAD